MVDKVYPLKLEEVPSGGGQLDPYPTEVKSTDDAFVIKEVQIVDDETSPKTQTVQQGIRPSSLLNRDIALFDRNSGEVGLSFLLVKSGLVLAGSFAGNPKKYTVTFATSYPNLNYSIAITGANARMWTYESKSTTGFVINTNANQALTDEVSWKTKRLIG